MKPFINLIPQLAFICFFIIPANVSNAQDSSSVVADSALLERIANLEEITSYTKPEDDHFMVVGLTTFGFVANKTTTSSPTGKVVSKTNSFPDADHYEFSPMLLWRHGKKFLLEFEPSFSGGQVGVNWGAISYFALPGLIIRGGYFVLPFGTYNKRLAAGWINKFASDPEGVAGATDYGVEVEGGLQAGTMKWSYDVAISNGMQLLPDGTIQSAGITDNNKNKTITARIGWLPLSNSSLEIGASIMTGKVGDAGTTKEKLTANLYGLDLNLVENIKPFQLNIKGQYSVTDVGHAEYINPVDSTNYSFTNHTTTGYIMGSLRPTLFKSFIKNFEVAARYGNYTTPLNSIWGTKDNSLALGLNYWLSWRAVIRYTFEEINGKSRVSTNLGGTPGATTKSNSNYLQFSIQL